MLRHDEGSSNGATATNGAGKTDKKKKHKKSKERPDSSAGSDWTWKEQVDLVKFTKSPIQASLLQLDSNELNKIALECFLSIMKYMGDYPMAKGQCEVDCVYTILMVRKVLNFKKYMGRHAYYESRPTGHRGIPLEHILLYISLLLLLLSRIATSTKRCVTRSTVRS